MAKKIAHEAVSSASGVQMITGVAAITLGILALSGLQAMLLTLIAMLAVSVSDLLSGTAIGGRMLSIFRS